MRVARLLRFAPLAAVAGLTLGVFAAQASQVSLLTGPIDPGNQLGTINSVIRSMNTAFAASGAGNIGDAIFIPSVSSVVNKFSMTPAATGVAPVLSVGGSGSDANIGIVLAGKGTGKACLAGSTCANSSLEAVTTTSAVNHVVVTGAVTSTGIPSIEAGGTGSDTNTAISLFGKGTGAVLVGGSTTTLAGLQVAQPASRVNGLLVTPGATGTLASLTSATAGADSNAGMFIAGSGTGQVNIGGTTTTLAGLQVAQTASRVNGVIVTPGATGTAASITGATAGADANVNLSVKGNGTGIVQLGQTLATCSGTTTATCQGQRFTVSITGLTTAASTLSAAMTVTNASVASSAAIVHCQTQGYAGTGVPVIVNIVPGTGSVAMNVQNVSTGAALNATVAIGCVVF